MRASSENLPIQDSAYDAILALDIIEHIPNDTLALSEIHRILKSDGAFVVFVPAYQFLWSFQDEISHHQRRYETHDLRSKILQAGFEINKLTYVNSFLYNGESVLYIDVYVTRIKFCVLCGVRARSRWFLDRSVSCIESSDRPKTI